MALRLSTILPRVFVIAVVALLATATLTFASSTRGGPAVNTPVAATAKADPARPGRPRPGLRLRQEHPRGGRIRLARDRRVQGYAANLVASQSPAPGSRVYDTGAPLISLGLKLNTHYPQTGSPENVSSFAGTVIQRVGVVTTAKAKEPKARPKAKPKAKPKKKAAPVHKPVVKKPVAKPKPHPTPHPKPKPKPKAKPARPPAFVVPGAKAEPLDEILLTTRATRLDTWLSSHAQPATRTSATGSISTRWIVTGAQLGWWHGAQALEILIRVDRKVESRWGIGQRSERVARAALAEVRRRSK